MRRFLYVALAAVLSAVVVYLCACVSGGILIDPKDPIFPSPELKEGVVEPRTRAITITKDNIAVTAEHWSRTRLNRKYTTVDMRSPFYYEEGWQQGFHSEVFYVTIKNGSSTNVVVDIKEAILEDDREYWYKPLDIGSFEYKFETRKMMDLKTKRGLDIAPQIMLDGALGPSRTVRPGETRGGFLPFNLPSSGATKVWLTVPLEREPENPTGSYERVEFRFDYVQDVVLRRTQPVVKR
jgi:hypothetical protein